MMNILERILDVLKWILSPEIPFGQWVKDGIDWLQYNIGVVFDWIQFILDTIYDAFTTVLLWPPYWVVIIIFALIAWAASSWRLAVFTVIGFWVIRSFDLWTHAMQTISLVALAVLIALVISIPVGILAAKVDGVSKVVKPILDLMQTMPAMVYLIPAITFFGLGATPGAVATIIFAMPPGVRLTELAIRQVDSELVEAGYAFGSTSGRVLRQIQLPVALPTIMAGVNQVIMLALSMVVIAGMAGAGGLGGDVTGSLSSLNVPLGAEAGLAVVIIAIYLDRVTASVANRRKKTKKVKATVADPAVDTTDSKDGNDAVDPKDSDAAASTAATDATN